MPVASVVRLAFDMNQSGNREDTLPPRSASGTQSMERASTVRVVVLEVFAVGVFNLSAMGPPIIGRYRDPSCGP